MRTNHILFIAIKKITADRAKSHCQGFRLNPDSGFFALSAVVQQMGLGVKVFLLLITFSLINCGKTDTPAPAVVVPVSELIKKTWVPQTVQENGTVVYTKGAASNIRAGYTNFQLSLSGSSTAILTEFDGNIFTGTYELQGDTKLILRNLNPQPSGSGGTIEYSITKSTATNLDLNRTSTSLKTGGSTNGYALVTK
jgi:hypothetical protein